MASKEPKWVEVSCVGENTEEKYYGKFFIKPFLKAAEKADAQRLADRYSIGIQPGPVKQLMQILAFLKFHVLESEAHWWKEDGLDLLDEEPAYALVDQLDKMKNPPKEIPDVT